MVPVTFSSSSLLRRLQVIARRSTWLIVAGYGLFLLLNLSLLAFRLETYPAVWFDEGYKMNAARTLAERGIYGTYTLRGELPFDPGISSGPADVIPAALSFRWFGAGVLPARWVSAAFTILASAALLSLAVYLYGFWPGLLTALVVSAWPAIGGVSFLLIGRQVLGEPASLALVLVGLRLWFAGWNRQQIHLDAAAGLCIGLGILSKSQIAIALLPTLLVIGLGRWRWLQTSALKAFLPTILALLVFGAWMLLGRLMTSAAVQQENSAMLWEAISANLLTPLLGRALTGSGLLLASIMLAGTAGGIWYVRQPVERLTSADDRRWAAGTLTLFVVLTLLWFTLFSIGWPRYAFFGLVVALLLLGRGVMSLVQWLNLRARLPYWAAASALIVAAVITNVLPAARYDQDGQAAQAVAAYIDQRVPAQAVVETWEWELTALSAHTAYHLPHQRYLFEAVRQFSRGQAFNLKYDVLQADPQYLVVGAFGVWTNLYPDAEIAAHFMPEARFGTYTIYRRTF